MTLKEKIYDHYLRVIDEKLAMLQQVLNDLKESGTNETKSTAGDKHETALAMLQIKQANTRAQLQELLNQKAALEKINPLLSSRSVCNGSLIKTNRGYFYICIAAGKAVIDNISVMAISPQSPLGQKLLGLEMLDTATVNDTSYLVENIQ